MKIIRSLLPAALALAACQIAPGQEPSRQEQEQARRDQLRIAVQEICPVSGQKLGSMGKPVKVAVGEQKEEIFLCCKGCAQGKIDPKHWARIHANMAAAQGKCPVMKKPLPAGAKWTVVAGQVVYVCCPPCIEKIEKDPKTFLSQVDGYYEAFLKEKQKAQEK